MLRWHPVCLLMQAHTLVQMYAHSPDMSLQLFLFARMKTNLPNFNWFPNKGLGWIVDHRLLRLVDLRACSHWVWLRSLAFYINSWQLYSCQSCLICSKALHSIWRTEHSPTACLTCNIGNNIMACRSDPLKWIKMFSCR